MNTNFKPLGLVAAVAAASAGYAGVVNAAASVAAETELGDLALVPYYTVMDGYSTGVNIINSSNKTQVLKFRFRRAVDSMDALDFNVVLSPEDMYTGFLSQGEGGKIFWTSNDNSCVAPAYGNLTAADNQFELPAIYSIGAETGYIEVISMGSPITEKAPIAVAAKHDSDGVPANCTLVRDNFFQNDARTLFLGQFDPSLTPKELEDVKADLAKAEAQRGVIDSDTTHQRGTDKEGKILTTVVASDYEASPDSLKVSYFIKSDETGVEFGDNAVHIAEFLDDAAMTNQQTGLFSGDLKGFDYPDLNGSSPLDAPGAGRTKYNELRDILGASLLINDWSRNSVESLGATVDTDWVVTFPGQYVMLNLGAYLKLGGISGAAPDCLRSPATAAANTANSNNPAWVPLTPCDTRDIPVAANFSVYDREEQGITVEEGELVVSPQPPSTSVEYALKDEVNVIQWGESSVLNAPVNISIPTPDGAKFGWASLSTTSSKNLALCDIDFTNEDEDGDSDPQYLCNIAATGSVPVIGFAAWQRAFTANPGSNYGRIVEHSRTQAAASAD
mgnify:CR=1 FL=1